MRFIGDKASFGRHETFPLRYSWLTKGFQALRRDPKVFESEYATVELGVGKNMVNSIKYWLQAAQLVEKTSEGLRATPVGLEVFDDDGYDPFLEDEATIWLIHWLLTTNCELATAWYWFFNRFHKPEFAAQEVANALGSFATNDLKVSTAPTTLKSDAAIILRMYVRSKGQTRTPIEEALDSPLAMLGLVSAVAGTKTFQSRPGAQESLPIGIFGFSVASLFSEMGVQQLPIADLMYGAHGYPAVGALFRLTEYAFLAKLERLTRIIPNVFEIRETAGIHQMYVVGDLQPLKYLRYHYVQPQGVRA